MVWFQCEDCGENLKKPKLANHFRMCSANKLSCIDCGVIFGQQSVQAHTQCITEAEKYGPKGQGKASSNTPAKANSEAKKKPVVDTNVGLSSRPPWYCSLCNTNATSKQTLLLHAEGKKHGAKARAFHASQQQSKETTELTSSTKDLPQGDSVCNKGEEPSKQDLSKSTSMHSEAQNGALLSDKKRKLVESDHENMNKKDSKGSDDINNGEVIQTKRGKTETDLAGDEKEAKIKKIKWKKLITSVLRSNPDGAMKLKKLQKLVLKSIQESGQTEVDQLKEKLVEKINSSSRFTLDNKIVRFVAKD